MIVSECSRTSLLSIQAFAVVFCQRIDQNEMLIIHSERSGQSLLKYQYKFQQKDNQPWYD